MPTQERETNSEWGARLIQRKGLWGLGQGNQAPPRQTSSSLTTNNHDWQNNHLTVGLANNWLPLNRFKLASAPLFPRTSTEPSCQNLQFRNPCTLKTEAGDCGSEASMGALLKTKNTKGRVKSWGITNITWRKYQHSMLKHVTLWEQMLGVNLGPH